MEPTRLSTTEGMLYPFQGIDITMTGYYLEITEAMLANSRHPPNLYLFIINLNR